MGQARRRRLGEREPRHPGGDRLPRRARGLAVPPGLRVRGHRVPDLRILRGAGAALAGGRAQVAAVLGDQGDVPPAVRAAHAGVRLGAHRVDAHGDAGVPGAAAAHLPGGRSRAGVGVQHAVAGARLVPLGGAHQGGGLGVHAERQPGQHDQADRCES